MKKIVIRNCSFLNEFPNPALVEGHGPGNGIEIEIDDLTINGVKCTGENEEYFMRRNNADITYGR